MNEVALALWGAVGPKTNKNIQCCCDAMRGLLYSEAKNAYATHFYVTSLNALELKATPVLTVALFCRESMVTLTVSNNAVLILVKFWILTAVSKT